MKNYKTFIKHYTTINLGLLILLLFSSLACEKLLDVEVPANQIGKDEVFKDVQTANAALAGLYAGLRDKSFVAGNVSGPWLGIYTDDLVSYAVTDTDGTFALYNNQQIDTNNSVLTLWSNSYQHIYAANAIIEGVSNSSFNTTDKNRVKGEALLVRSMQLFYLQQLFGDIPYPLTTNYTINQSLPKVNANEVLLNLEADLLECTNLLSDDYKNFERIYPNRKVAQLILAKTYMLEQKWAKAEILLKEIASSPLYTFQNDITKVFTKSSAHILWQLKPQNSTDPTREAILYYFSGIAPSTYALSPDLINSFAPNDLRKQNWTALVNFNGNSWYRAEKYKNRTNNTTEYSVVFRLEEVYLLLAETLAQQNKAAEALSYLNPTVQRAGLNILQVPISQNDLLNNILLESRKEFFVEMGHRFLDLKRTGKLSELSAAKPNWKNFHRLWPIPQKELLLNPNLNPQNNGY